MIDIASWRGPIRYHLVLFATIEQARAMQRDLKPNEIVRFRHALDDLTPLDAAAAPVRTVGLDLTKTEDELLHGMHAKSCRYEIRRADKLGDRLQVRSGTPCHADFVMLYNDFVAEKGYTRPLSDHRFRAYSARSDIYVAYLDDEPVVGHLIARDEDTRRARLIFSASRRLKAEYKSIAGPVNRYAHWAEIRDYKAASFRYFDFGGIGGSDVPGPIRKFKMSFGSEIEVGYDLMVQGSVAGLALRGQNAAAAGLRAVKGLRSGLVQRRNGGAT
jgi:hypothetical protein